MGKIGKTSKFPVTFNINWCSLGMFRTCIDMFWLRVGQAVPGWGWQFAELAGWVPLGWLRSALGAWHWALIAPAWSKSTCTKRTASSGKKNPTMSLHVATTLVLFVLFHAQPRSSGSFVQCHKQSPAWNSYTVGGLEYSKPKQLSVLSRGPADWNLPPSSTFHVCAFLTCNRSYLPLQKGVERRVVCIVCRAAHVPQLSQTATALGKTLLRHCHFDCIVLYFDVFRCIWYNVYV